MTEQIHQTADERNAAIRLTMMPRDTNAHGTVFGGVILSYIDVAGGVEAVRHTRHDRFVTMAMKEVIFHEPVFMGDLGALAIGGALGIIAVMSKNEVVSAIIHLVFLAEIISVMLQVASFKLTKKRIFKMAPLHHHFELSGRPEPKIIVRFWILSILVGAVALLSLKLR